MRREGTSRTPKRIFKRPVSPGRNLRNLSPQINAASQAGPEEALGRTPASQLSSAEANAAGAVLEIQGGYRQQTSRRGRPQSPLACPLLAVWIFRPECQGLPAALHRGIAGHVKEALQVYRAASSEASEQALQALVDASRSGDSDSLAAAGSGDLQEREDEYPQSPVAHRTR